MKAVSVIILLLFSVGSICASPAYYESLRSSIYAMEFADAALKKCSTGKANARQLKSLELAMTQCAKGFQSGTQLEVSDEMKQSLVLAGGLLSNAAYSIKHDLDTHTLSDNTLVKAQEIAGMLPSYMTGILSALAENNDPAGNLTLPEREALIQYVNETFGKSIKGSDVVNGTTPFERSASLIQAYLISSIDG